MIVQRAYSFCDAMELIGKPPEEACSRIYIGSSFCDQYFLRVSSAMWERARASGMKLTLVVPIPGQSRLRQVKEKLDDLISFFSDALDEAVVNDYAMLGWIGSRYPSLSLWCGRLLVKDTRDPRYSDGSSTCKLLDHLKAGSLFGYPVKGVELDLFAPLQLDRVPPVILGVHLPYGYVSTGRLCEAASIGKAVKEKFRPASGCSGQCEKTWITYDSGGVPLLKYGRAVYSRTDVRFLSDGLPPETRVRLIDDGFAAKLRRGDEAPAEGDGA